MDVNAVARPVKLAGPAGPLERQEGGSSGEGFHVNARRKLGPFTAAVGAFPGVYGRVLAATLSLIGMLTLPSF